MRNRMVISIDLKIPHTEQPMAYYKIKSNLTRDVNFLVLLGAIPRLQEELYERLESGSRYLVDHGYIQLEQMRKLLEETTDSSIEAIDRIRKLVKAEV